MSAQKTPAALDRIVDAVLAHRPKPASKPAKKRARRKTMRQISENKAKESLHRPVETALPADRQAASESVEAS